MGPLELADLIGLDTVLAIADVLHRDIGDDKYRAPTLLRNLVAAGWLGSKTGRGFYTYYVLRDADFLRPSAYDAPARNAKSQSARHIEASGRDIHDDLLQVARQRKISVKFASIYGSGLVGAVDHDDRVMVCRDMSDVLQITRDARSSRSP